MLKKAFVCTLDSPSAAVPHDVPDGRRRGGDGDGAEHGRARQRALGHRRIQARLHADLVLRFGVSNPSLPLTVLPIQAKLIPSRT